MGVYHCCCNEPFSRNERKTAAYILKYDDDPELILCGFPHLGANVTMSGNA